MSPRCIRRQAISRRSFLSALVPLWTSPARVRRNWKCARKKKRPVTLLLCLLAVCGSSFDFPRRDPGKRRRAPSRFLPLVRLIPLPAIVDMVDRIINVTLGESSISGGNDFPSRVSIFALRFLHGNQPGSYVRAHINADVLRFLITHFPFDLSRLVFVILMPTRLSKYFFCFVYLCKYGAIRFQRIIKRNRYTRDVGRIKIRSRAGQGVINSWMEHRCYNDSISYPISDFEKKSRSNEDRINFSSSLFANYFPFLRKFRNDPSFIYLYALLFRWTFMRSRHFSRHVYNYRRLRAAHRRRQRVALKNRV